MKIAGIRTETYANGRLKSVTIDMKKYGEKLKPFLEEVGVLEHDDFEERWKNALTVEESIKETKKLLREKWNKEKLR